MFILLSLHKADFSSVPRSPSRPRVPQYVATAPPVCEAAPTKTDMQLKELRRLSATVLQELHGAQLEMAKLKNWVSPALPPPRKPAVQLPIIVITPPHPDDLPPLKPTDAGFIDHPGSKTQFAAEFLRPPKFEARPGRSLITKREAMTRDMFDEEWAKKNWEAFVEERNKVKEKRERRNAQKPRLDRRLKTEMEKRKTETRKRKKLEKKIARAV
ncbi:hypothetical protein EDC01DRAFT_781050 [Geopyxis carbonaria]|nr:hypothetical protein EDC01DRAFT_781050 [Geopyxis carbonaria]